MSDKKNNQKGIAILLVVMILGVIIVISMAISDLVMNQMRLAVYSGESIRAYYAAESGIEEGLYKLRTGAWLPEIEMPVIEPVYLLDDPTYYYVLEIEKEGAVQVLSSEGNYKNTRRKIEVSY